jgi:hypothetical protein
MGLAAGLSLLASGMASAQDQSAAPRTLDLVTGVLLYCMPAAAEAWTKEFCASIDKEAATLAKTAKVHFVALKTTDTDTTNKQKARDAGFDPANALWLLVKVQRMSPGARPGWNISLRADANTLPHPVNKGQSQRLIFTQGATLDAGISSREAEKGGKMLLEAFFEASSKPIKLAAQ